VSVSKGLNVLQRIALLTIAAPQSIIAVAFLAVLLLCIAFGLSMGYEVFLLSRIREYWLRSGQTHADNGESVALGLAGTGRVITAAAAVMSISFAALLAAHVRSCGCLAWA
jgi:uncharacterized membrane protein YdfJ with MMPL/SSD domain